MLYEPRHKKTCLCHMRPTKVQISLRICAVWSVRLYSLPSWYVTYNCYIRNSMTLASFCSWAGCFVSYLVTKPWRQLFSWRGSYVFSSPEPKAHKVSLQYTNGLLSVVIHTLKLEYLWSQFANLDQILCVVSQEWGKGCIKFWGGFDQNSGFHGNRKPPLTYNGENDVCSFSRLFMIRSFLYVLVTRTCIKSRTSSNFGEIGPLTMELAALEHLKNFP